MEARIRRLEGAIVDQIAAGEVVERPASVVKELLENALDAGATTVRVDVADGGKDLVRVADDGHGMDPEDLALSVERHATSKIRGFDDLARIRTLGFRGEALPSIASVSRFSIASRRRDSIGGSVVRIDGGSAKAIESAGLAPGTVVEVRDLFFNVPARRKFLKSRVAEARQITDVCLRAALARPELRLTLTHDDRTVRTFLPALGLAARAAEVFEDEPLRAIDAVRGSLGVEAMLGDADRAQRGARRLYVFVNGRPVADAKLARQVAFAYGSALAPGLYPSGVVWIRLPPEEVDVNAHPQKAEVRFADERGVFDALTRMLAQELETRPFARAGSAATRFWEERLHRPAIRVSEGAGPLFDAAPPSSQTAADPWGIGAALRATIASPTAAPTPTQAPIPTPRTGGWFARLRFVGTVRDAYLVCEDERSLVLVDLAAAELERLVGEARRALADGALPSRRLLFPARAEVGTDEVEAASRARDRLATLGFDVEPIGPRTLAVHRVPAAIRDSDPVAALRAALALARREPPHVSDRELADLLRPAARTAGASVDAAAGRALLDALDALRGGDPAPPAGAPIVRTYPLPER